MIGIQNNRNNTAAFGMQLSAKNAIRLVASRTNAKGRIAGYRVAKEIASVPLQRLIERQEDQPKARRQLVQYCKSHLISTVPNMKYVANTSKKAPTDSNGLAKWINGKADTVGANRKGDVKVKKVNIQDYRTYIAGK